ncbi:MAG: hypothetical protein OXP71_03955 [Candidatus Poribacteria bacterium]|nr:hypothetical protein [Candidatus Poribacteria bacterium]
MRKISIAIFVIAAIANPALVVYSHCHNTYPCEQVQSRVVGPWEWATFHVPVDWYINPTQSGMPSLTTDVTAAANSWSNIQRSDGTTIDFSYRSQGLIDAEAGDYDNKNVVSWVGMENSPNAAVTYIWLIGGIGPLIDEVDIGFNYYKDWKTHANKTDGYLCIRDTAAHEWGHAAGLKHVKYDPTKTSGIGNCPAWQDYTMHAGASPNSHDRESLACEDKWALDYKY